MEKRFITSVLEMSQHHLQEGEIKSKVIWKIQGDLYLTVATPSRIILVLLFNRHLKPYSFCIKYFSKKCIFYEIFNRCRTHIFWDTLYICIYYIYIYTYIALAKSIRHSHFYDVFFRYFLIMIQLLISIVLKCLKNIFNNRRLTYE